MALLDLSKARARKTKSLRRRDCTTYQDAYEYFKYNVKQWQKYEDITEIPIWGEDAETKELCLELSLHQMPLYWAIEELEGERSIKKWDAAAGKLVEERKVKHIKGQPLYPVDSHEAGWELIQALAATEDDDFKAILTRAAAAMVYVEHELEAINEYAEVLYNESEWNAALGMWHLPDDGTKQSKKKAQKKSQFKQLARRQLGYQRATDTFGMAV